MNTFTPWFARKAILPIVVLFLTACAGLKAAAASTHAPSEGSTPQAVGDTPESLEKSGLIAYSQGRHDDAAHDFAKAIAAIERDGGASAPGLGQLLSDLAWLYHEEGLVTEADSLLRTALAIDQQAFRPGALPVARRTQELGMLYHAQGKFIEARRLLFQALATYEWNPETDARELAIAQNQIGVNYHATGDLARGELFIKRALDGLARDAGDRRYWAAALLDLAELYRSAHRDTEARQAFTRALHESRAISSPDGLENGLEFNSHSVLLRRIEETRGTDQRNNGEAKMQRQQGWRGTPREAPRSL